MFPFLGKAKKALKLFFYALEVLVVVNAVIVILSSTRPSSPAVKEPPPQKKGLDSCCKDVCQGSRNRNSSSYQYAEIANKTPDIDPSYRRDTMVRLGTDLNFDLKQCPSGSYMPSRRRNFTPEHFDCPTLYIVGARKGGTSSLYQYVSNHPEFEGTRLDAGPKAGETFYFSRYYKKSTWEQYLSLFPPDGVMTGDSSVGNLVYGPAPRKIYQACGKQAKIVMLLRDPVWRLESNFLMRARRNSARVSNGTSISTIVKIELDKFFHEVLERTHKVSALPREWSKLVGLFDPAISMVYEGLYYVHLLNWLCNFPAENILVINSEEFFRNPSKILDIVLQFLGLRRLDAETYSWITLASYNKGRYSVPSYQRLSHRDKMTLLGVYRPFNKALLPLLKWDNAQWMMDDPL